ncbi:MAG: chromosomal replication initiator protein DnaA [candidate division Zixibacteria bacterium]|nr:chromosomal replication initiator protein DnaA [candidate division Zixibacteria bacterium]
MENLNESIWNPCLEYLQELLGKEVCFTWFKPTRLIAVDGNAAVIGVPNNFVANWMREHYSTTIDDALKAITGRDWSHRFEIHQIKRSDDHAAGNNGSGHVVRKAPSAVAPIPVDKARSVPPPRPTADRRASASLNCRYTFNNFVVGQSNQLAHAAAVAASKQPGEERHNPLFIYGTVGLGKTHLAQAIGNALVSQRTDAKVLYVTSEDFTNHFIRALSNGTTAEFTDRYRSVDVLLIDDIQFLAGKESTQEQFFHTFNALHQQRKQIVLTGDRAPKEIRGLEERLLSRFQWGLPVDIHQPDFETRMAILRKKLEQEHTTLSDEVLGYIARAGNGNIRELEGALNRLLAATALEGKEITLETAQELLRDSLTLRSRPITIPRIIAVVSDLYAVPKEAILSKRRTQSVALARHTCMYLARTLTNLSLKAVGAEFGGKDHSTVIHAVNTIRDSIGHDAHLRSLVEQAQAMLCGNSVDNGR